MMRHLLLLRWHAGLRCLLLLLEQLLLKLLQHLLRRADALRVPRLRLLFRLSFWLSLSVLTVLILVRVLGRVIGIGVFRSLAFLNWWHDRSRSLPLNNGRHDGRRSLAADVGG